MTHNHFFIQGKIFNREESESVEFKSIENSSNPINQIKNDAEEYVVGFINAQTEGDLYFGIENKIGTITGVKLNREQRDQLSSIISQKLRQTVPSIPMEYYKLEIHNIYNEKQELIEDLHVVHIHVIKTADEVLYTTSGGSVYRKKETTNFKLIKQQDFADEYKRRHQIPLRKEAYELDEKLKKDPNNRDFLSRRANIAMWMSDVEIMDTCHKKLLELNPTSSKIRNEYAIAYKEIGDLEGALSILDDALQSGINNASILKNKGFSLQGLGRWEEARQSYQQALEKEPDDYTLLTQIGITLRQLGKYKESIQFLNYALKKSPTYRLAKYEKRITYHQMFKGGIGIRNNSATN